VLHKHNVIIQHHQEAQAQHIDLSRHLIQDLQRAQDQVISHHQGRAQVISHHQGRAQVMAHHQGRAQVMVDHRHHQVQLEVTLAGLPVGVLVGKIKNNKFCFGVNYGIYNKR